MRKLSVFLVIVALLMQPIFSESDTSYDDTEFPQWSMDLRRTEIIMFGSLPFVTLWTTLGYSVVVYGEFRNPLSKNTDSLTVDDQKRIIGISAGVCVGLGLFDLVVTLVKRAAKRKDSRVSDKLILAYPIENSPSEDDSDDGGYLIEGVVENAVF